MKVWRCTAPTKRSGFFFYASRSFEERVLVVFLTFRNILVGFFKGNTDF